MKNLYFILLIICFFIINPNLGQTWSSVGSGTNMQVRAMAVYNGELYVGGQFDHAGGIAANFIARWDGVSWDSVGTGLIGGSGIYSMAVYAGELYVGGYFFTAGGVSAPMIAKWNGTTWSPVGASLSNIVNTLTVHNGALYAGGQFSAFNRVAKWDGTSWSGLGTGLNFDVKALTTYNNKLYAAGDYVYSFDGMTWNNKTLGLTSVNAGNLVNALLQYDGELYAGGDIATCGTGITSNGIARIVDSASHWFPVGSGLVHLADANTMISYNGELITGGRFYSTFGNHLLKWNGSTWAPLGTDVIGTGSSWDAVNALVEYKGELYVGGYFGMTANGVFTTHIAKFHSATGSTDVCFGECDGTVSVNPIAGTPPYTFLWDSSAGNQTSSTATNLCAGTYTVSVTDSMGVVTNYSATISQPTTPLTSLIISPTICDSACITLNGSANGGIAPYNYYWGVSLDPINPTICTDTSISYNFTIIDAAGCSQTGISSIVVNPSPLPPSINLLGQSNICPGDSSLLQSPLIAGTSIQWLNNNTTIAGATDTLFSPISAGLYSIVATNVGGCSDTSTAINISQYLDCDTWPGDANNDTIVDNNDLLPIGLYFGQTGLARSTTSNLWQAWPSTDWGIAQTNNQDIKHSDSNGDGIIDNNDTLAVNVNFSLTHSFAPIVNDERFVNPDIYIITSSNSYLPGDIVNAEIWLGTSTLPLTNLYGIAFNIDYDASLIQTGSESLTYPSSWLGIPGTNTIKLSKIDNVNSIAYGAETRITHTNASGYGKIADFKFQLKNMISSLDSLNLSVSYTNAIDSAGIIIPLNPSGITIQVIPVGVHEIDNLSNLTIYPNPYTSNTQINYALAKNAFINLEIFNALGQKIETLANENQLAGNHSYSFSAKAKGYEAGVYFVKMTIDGITTTKRIIEMK